MWRRTLPAAAAGLFRPGVLLLFATDAGFAELDPHPSGGYGHDYGLNGTDLLIGQALFFGDAKVVLHSRISSKSHGRSHVQHEGCFRFQGFILAR